SHCLCTTVVGVCVGVEHDRLRCDDAYQISDLHVSLRNALISAHAMFGPAAWEQGLVPGGPPPKTLLTAVSGISPIASRLPRRPLARRDGNGSLLCCSCGEPYPYAEPEADGHFVCCSCRTWAREVAS